MFAIRVNHSNSSFLISQPLDQWNLEQILDWMAVTGLSRYLEVIKGLESRPFRGSDLLALSDERLNTRIRDPFYRGAVLRAVRALNSRLPGEMDPRSRASSRITPATAVSTDEVFVFNETAPSPSTPRASE